ncbi:hypothetical protein [Variovorax sp. ZT4R33]|uniref:hypothetical protein n=1 Tax=Variovorax sp. ZT4R33 TaxID=3443743 RepID=UPI003F4770C7
MPLRESLPDELIDNVADLLRLRNKAQGGDLSAWAEKMLQTACRSIDCFVEPAASVEAVAQWEGNGGAGDLRAQKARAPSRAKKWAGLHCEVAMPAAQLFDDLTALGPVPGAPRVREVLETADIVWLTKAQVAELPRGYRDWRAFSKTLQLAPKR